MSRKDVFANLKPQAAESVDAPPPKARNRPLIGEAESRYAPIAAVSKSVGDLNERSRRANEIESRLAEGQAVIDMNPAEIDPSFVQDRMPGDIDGLVASIREQGQQVPILVRPHPDQPGRYQVAFGHRRLRAVAELGISVKTVVRNLTDEQLVIAQGQENNERQDLTFIEKARFVHRLQERFPRDIIVASMSLDKSLISKMLSILESIPADVIDAIGPAPGIGRPSWESLATLFDNRKGTADAIDFVSSMPTQGLASAERFKALLAHLKPRKAARGLPGVWLAGTGEQLAKVTENKTKVEITIDRKEAPEFAAFVLEEVQKLFEERRSNGWRPRSTKNGE